MELVKRTVENSRKSDMQINKGQARYPFTIGKYPESSNIGHSKKIVSIIPYQHWTNSFIGQIKDLIPIAKKHTTLDMTKTKYLL